MEKVEKYYVWHDCTNVKITLQSVLRWLCTYLRSTIYSSFLWREQNGTKGDVYHSGGTAGIPELPFVFVKTLPMIRLILLHLKNETQLKLVTAKDIHEEGLGSELAWWL